MMQVMLAALFLFANVMCINAGTNFDATWTKTCPNGQSIYHVSSVHSNPHEDRSWTFLCRPDSKITTTCQWSGFVNSYDQKVVYQCPNGVITGVHSTHSNEAEDRRFSFRCCNTQSNCARDCVWSGYVNNFDGYLNYVVPSGSFLTGAQSFHDNGNEDRRWEFLACKRG
ncbi:Hypothetical predicted protein [Paramuricea clavata]|uniref:Uncharacterized protein n=1 Tax=Paramuricea clavata TaxID=317549 RepID=A0A7D9J5I1_PARCT|nr:Hypothetical predicted protein [Paramuricea clavata]